MRKAILAVLLAGAALGPAAPAGARHQDPHCALTVHHPLGTDEVVASLPADPPDEDVPTDVGFVKVFVLCRHGR